MNCEDALELLTEYVDNQLPEVTRRRVNHHLAVCSDCRKEYDMWVESGRLIHSDNTPAMVRSIVDAVMARILSEEKWAIPLGKRMFSVTPRMRRIGWSVAAVFLLVCSFAVFSNTGGDTYHTELVAGDKRAVVSATIEPIEPVDHAAEGLDPGGVIPSVQNDAHLDAAMQPFESGDGVQGKQPNHSLMLGIFGILLTVLGLSWFTRA